MGKAILGHRAGDRVLVRVSDDVEYYVVIRSIEKGEDEDTAEYCAVWLAEHSLIDDERYAAAVARHYAAKGYGAGRVRAELSRRGIDRELWDGAVGAMPAGDGKIDKFISSRLHDPDDRDEVRKLSQALYRRGYSWEEIRSALERHRAEIFDDQQ